MGTRRVAGLLTGCLLLVLAGPSPQPAAAAPVLAVALAGPDRSVILGRTSTVVAHVVDGGSGQPVAGTQVELLEQGVPVGTTTSDADGAAVFDVLPSQQSTYSAVAEGVISNEVVLKAVTSAPIGPVDGPQLVPGSRDIAVSWSAPYDDGGGVDGYDVFVKTSSAFGSVAQLPPTARSYDVSGLEPSADYYVAVVPWRGAHPATVEQAYVVGDVRTGAGPPAAGGTGVCGTLPAGTTTWSATGAPYRLCPAGVTVPVGSALVLDGSAGGFDVVGASDLLVRGDVRTAATSPTDRVRLDRVNVLASSPSVLQLAAVDLVSAGLAGRVLALALADATVTGGVSTGRAGTPLGDGVRVSADHGVSLVGLSVSAVTVRGLDVWAGSRLLVQRVLVDGARDQGARLGADDLRVDGLEVDRTNLGIPSIREPGEAVLLWSPQLALGPGGVEEITGAANGIDAVLLDGTIRSDLTWVAPTNSAGHHVLGYVGGDLTVPSGVQLLVPAATTYAGVGTLRVDGTLSTGDGALLTSRYDPATHLPCTALGTTSCVGADGLPDDSCGEGICTSTQGDWPGIEVNGSFVAHHVTVAHARTGVTLGSGTVQLEDSAILFSSWSAVATGSNSTGALRLLRCQVVGTSYGPGLDVTLRTLDVEDSVIAATHGPGLVASASSQLTVVRSLVRDAGGPGMVLTADQSSSVHDDIVRRSRGAAVLVRGSGWTYGPDGNVGGLRGGGNTFDSVEIEGAPAGDVPYGEPVQAYADHDLTPVLAGSESEPFDDLLPQLVVQGVQPRDQGLAIAFATVSRLLVGDGDTTPTAFEIAVSGAPSRLVPPGDSALVTGLVNGRTYAVNVRAVNGDKKGGWWSTTWFGRPAPAPDPALITEGHVVPRLGGLAVSWTTGRTVLVSATAVGSDGTVHGLSQLPDGRSAGTTGLRQTTTYRVELRPYDAYATAGPLVARIVRGTSLLASSARISPGQSVVLTSLLRDQATRQALAGQRVTVWSRVQGASTWTLVGALTTASTGRANLAVRPSRTTSYRFGWPGNAGRMAAQVVGTVTVG